LLPGKANATDAAIASLRLDHFAVRSGMPVGLAVIGSKSQHAPDAVVALLK
jgi:hypothetical protein